MNKLVKISMIGVGFILIGYAIYNLMNPQAFDAVKTSSANIKNGNDTYFTLVLGIVAVVLGWVIGKRYK